MWKSLARYEDGGNHQLIGYFGKGSSIRKDEAVAAIRQL